MYNENEFGESGTYNAPNTPPAEPVQQPFADAAQTDFQPQKPVSTKKEKKSSSGKLIALALCCSLVGGILGAVGGVLAMHDKVTAASGGNSTVIQEGQRENTVIDVQKIDTDKVMTPAEVYAANVNSTVGITTSITTNYWGYQTTSAASGSGFILTADGYILTNYHVIEGSSGITVSFYDGNSMDAELIGYDESNDIAVLKVEAEGLTPVTLGDSDNLNVGDTVLAIGNPLGELTFSLTVGTMSALDREVTTSTGITMNLMQTDCAINSGNSGGALFNLYGEVIGITNAKYSSSSSTEASIDNIGFAIPINSVKRIVESIIENGYISKPYMGVSVTDVSEETQSYGLPKGAAVKAVAEDSPAAEAGLQVNDIITHVDGEAVDGSNALVNIVSNAQIGQKLTLTVFRQGTTLEITVTIGEQIQAAAEESESQPEQSNGQYPFPWGGFFGY